MTEVRVDRHGHVGVIKLEAAARRNALTVSMAEELRSACAAINDDPTIGAAVIWGAGGTFCAGAEFATLARVAEDPAESSRYEALDTIYDAFMSVRRLAVPSIAAIEGAAVGAGLNLMLACDLRVIAEDAQLIAGFLRIGVHPGGGSLTMLARLAGREAAAAMAIFGEVVDGRRAQDLGLAWATAPAGETLDAALKLAEQAAGDPPLARVAIDSLRVEAEQGLPVSTALEFERARQLWSLRRRGNS